MFRVTITRPIAAWLIASIGALHLATAVALARELKVEGLSFSDEKGSFRLLSVSGKGTPEDPIIVTEEVTGPDEPVLIIRGFGAKFGNRAGSFHTAAFAMKKIAINRTSKTWLSYRLELREVQTRHSNYEDGLSFGQDAAIADAYTSSPTFPNVERIYEPADMVTFNGAEVPPGDRAVMQFVITDMSPVYTFFLFQQPAQLVSQRETPGAAAKTARLSQRMLR